MLNLMVIFIKILWHLEGSPPLIYLKSTWKSDSFDLSIDIKILFFRVSVSIEPGRSLLTVRYHEPFGVFLENFMTIPQRARA